MSDALRAVVYLLGLRLGPKDLPNSLLLVYVTVSAYAAAVVATLLLTGMHPLLALGGVAVDVALVVLWCALLLVLKNQIERLPEVLLCIFAAWTPLQIALLPIAAAHGDGSVGNTASGIAFGITIWMLVILANALRQALPTNWFSGAFFALGYFFFSLQIAAGIFGTE